MGVVLHSFGLLASDNIQVTSALDLEGQYLGQSKEKVQKMVCVFECIYIFYSIRAI